MQELSNIYSEVGQKIIDDLLNDYVTVTEKISGSSFSFEQKNNQLNFYKGSYNRPINLIDRTLMMYYEKPIVHIKQISENLNIPNNFKFCFQYFINNTPSIINYDNLPENGLVLTHIIDSNNKNINIIDESDVIKIWARRLQVSPMLPIFKGLLSDSQKKKIKNFITTPKEDHYEIFKTSSFAEFIVGILNPTQTSTLLQNDLTKPIESIIFKFKKRNETISAKLIDPYTANLMKNKEPIYLKQVPADINEILLLDILGFITSRGLLINNLTTTTTDERYIELISNIFNDYINIKGNDIKNINIEKYSFADGPEFDLNLDFIKNKKTNEYLSKSEIYKDLFKIILGSLRKKRNLNKASSIMTQSNVNDFNDLVELIRNETSKEIDTSFKTFKDYLSIKTESVNYENVEDLIIEEKILKLNEFINIGKINL